jgi:hypothetical protein
MIGQKDVMDRTQTRTAIITFLESALKFAEEINDTTTAYLIERALDEARSQGFSSVSAGGPTH